MDKKTFIVTWETNYGLSVAIINTTSIEEAKNICDNSSIIWEGYDINELETTEEIYYL